MSDSLIRPASPGDHAAIRNIFRHAFARDDEANLVERLRADGDVLVELVAASGDALQGAICFSRLTIERQDGPLACAALAPMAVLPAFQRMGVGRDLVRGGLGRCAVLGLEAILVLGHPDYYPRFGFSAAAAATLEAPFSGPSFMGLELSRRALAAGGRVRYARAFGV